jgi:hypothetical protein
MFYRTLADYVIITHFAFVVFAVFGAFLVLKWRRIAWIHIPTALWAAIMEFSQWICPLTHLEHWLRVQSGVPFQNLSFVERYILPLVYPTLLTPRLQFVLGALVLGLNGLIYGWILWRDIKTRPQK